MSVDIGEGAVARDALEALSSQGRRTTLDGFGDDRLGQGVLRFPFNGSDEGEEPIVLDALRDDVHNLGLTLGQSSGLVHDDDFDVCSCFEGHGVLEEHTAIGPSPVPSMIAVGVARPGASGQVMTTTVMANNMASPTGRPASTLHTRKVPVAADEGDQDEPER
nr:hypothetical protein [Iamia sp. SCSIO 61187]